MKELIKKGAWGFHRLLCQVGIHAPEQIFLFDDKSDEFKPDGWFCAVCTKTWENN